MLFYHFKTRLVNTNFMFFSAAGQLAAFFLRGGRVLDYRATILLYAELLLALYLLWREGLLRTRSQQAAVFALVPLAFALRYCFLTYETLDYQDWLKVWIQSLRDNGPWKGLGQEIWSCNYNVPYLYFLSLFSVSDIYDLLLVKLLSIFFDVVLAWGAMRLTGVLSPSPARKLTAFIAVLWLPSVILNGSLWGQCDCIYAAFAVLAVYLVLDGKPALSVAAAALSVSFKLQGVFLLPAYFLFLIAGKIKIRHIFVFPAVYILSILPAVLAGRGFWELLTLYVRNTGSIGSGLNYNASSLYALLNFDSLENTTAARVGIVLTFFFCCGLYVWLTIRVKGLTDRALFGAVLLFCIGVPFLLPHMHDRYFFMADVLTVVAAVVCLPMALGALAVNFGSLLGYHAYLKMRYLLPMRYGAAAMLFALAAAGVFTALSLGKEDLPAPGE